MTLSQGLATPSNYLWAQQEVSRSSLSLSLSQRLSAFPSFPCTHDDPFLGSCTLLLRIGRDFGSDVIPMDDGGYLDATGWPTEGLASSFELLLPLQLDLIPGCVGGEGIPGWEPLAAHPPQYMRSPGFALVLSSTSRMAQRWGPGVAGELNHTSLGLLNHTSLGLVEIS